jgi:type II secretory pathway pseudopilin PulG
MEPPFTSLKQITNFIPLEKDTDFVFHRRGSFSPGFTLTEVIVGAILLAIIFGGLLASFISVRKYINRANKRLVSANLARGVLNGLYREVNADWDTTGGLTIGPHNNALNTTIDSYTYTGNYTVSSTGNDYRQVTINIIYPAD